MGSVFEIRDLKKRFPSSRLPDCARRPLSRLGLLSRRDADGQDTTYRLEIGSLVIPSGIVALLGMSGSGKSTLLNILAGLDTSYRGDVSLNTNAGPRKLPTDEREADRFRRDHFSFVFQSSNLLTNLPVKMNVELSRCLAGAPSHGCDGLLGQFFGPDGHLLGLRFPSELSVGQRQRVALCRALLKASDGATVLFADEPTASLDRENARQCFELLEAWVSESPGRLLLLATHDLHLAAKASHYIEIGALDEHGCESKGVHGVRFAGNKEDYENRRTQMASTAPAPPGTKGTVRITGPKADGGPAPLAGGNLGFLLHYAWKDSCRPREALDLSCRLAIILFLFVVLMGAATLAKGAPVLARKIIENNRLLRMVELESTGSFPISEEKQRHLASLRELDGDVLMETSRGHAGRALVSGVSPNLWFPLQFFRADGKLNGRWTDAVRQVHASQAPHLSEDDRIFSFWGIEAFEVLAPGELPRMLVTPTLLSSLGYDPGSFSTWVRQRDPRACLFARGEDEWTLRLPVERIEDLPDQNVAILIPARLARMVEQLDPRIVSNRRYLKYELGPVSPPMEAKLARAEAAMKREHSVAIRLSLERALLAGDGSWAIRCVSEKGLEQDAWASIGRRIEEALGAPLPRRGCYGQADCGTQVPDSWAPPLKANMATLFVEEYSDVPGILGYLEQHRDTLKVRVVNATNLEFVRTVLLSMRFGERVLVVVALTFLASCLMGIGYSSLASIQRRIGELGILRAFGATPAFVAGRFVLELSGLCLAGAGAAWGLLDRLALPWINACLGELSPAFRSGSVLLRCGPEALAAAAGIWLATVLVVLMVIGKHIRQCPSMLLSMKE